MPVRTWADKFARRGIEGQAFAGMADPADLFGRHPDHKCMGWDIPRNHRARADEGEGPDRAAADDGGVRPDAGAAGHAGWCELVHSVDVGARCVDVGEDGRRPDEDVVFQGHALVDADIVLDLAAVADPHVGAGHDVLAERAADADPGARDDVTEMPYARVVADLDAVIDIGRFMNNGGRHDPSS